MRTLLRIPALMLVSVLLAGCAEKGSIEDQVRNQVGAMEAAGEAGERLAFMGFVADDFLGQNGAMTRDDFRRFMFFQFSQQRRIKAQLFPITVNPLGTNLAEADFRALVTGGGGLIPDDGQFFNIHTEWAFEGGEWLLWRANWEPTGP